MRRLRSACGLLLSAVLAGVLAIPSRAADEDYTYTVRFYSGQQGVIDGREMLELEGLRYGERVTFDRNSVDLTDGSKYYIRGIRESGKDNNTIGAMSFEVTGDQDYVVAYGLLGSAVAYHINYVDTDGRTLAPDETYYGNVGDKPVIAFLYVEGYVPQAYNLTKTLSANAAENEFTFVYTRDTGSAPQTPQTGTTQDTPDTEDEEGAQTGPAGAGQTAGAAGGALAADAGGAALPGAAGGGAGQAAGAGGAAGGAGAADGGAGDGAAADGGLTDAADEQVPETGPQEIRDLDDEEVPRGSFNDALASVLDVEPDAVWFRVLNMAAGAAAAAILAAGLWFYWRKRRKKE